MFKHLHDNLTPTEKKLGWCYWLFQLFVLPVAMPMVNDYFGSPLTDLELNFLFFCINALLLVLMLHKYVFKSIGHGISRPFRTLRIAVVWFGIYWLLSMAATQAALYLDPEFINANDASIADMAAEGFTLTAIGTVLLVPIAEEIMYRGVIFGSIYHRSKLLAYVVSIVLFAAVHLMGYITEYTPMALLAAFLQYLPAGLCLAIAYARTGSILAPVLMHIAINQIGISTMR